MEPSIDPSNDFLTAFRRDFFGLVGALPLLSSFLFFFYWFKLSPDIELPRLLALFLLMAGGIFLVAATLSAFSVSRIIRRWSALARALRILFFLGVLGNLCLIGVTAFSPDLRHVAGRTLAIAGVLGALSFARFFFLSIQDQALVTRLLIVVGQASLVLLLAVSPWVGWLWVHDVPPQLPPFSAKVRKDPPRRIVLVTFDALREDGTSIGSPREGNTPYLQALANQSWWATHCVAASDRTRNSFLTILSGVRPSDVYPSVPTKCGYYPRQGTVASIGYYLDPAGYRSYFSTMFVNPSIYGMKYDFAGGFMAEQLFFYDSINGRSFAPFLPLIDYLNFKFHRHRHPNGLMDADATIDKALDYLKKYSGRRIFLWVHLGVPHSPYYDVPARGPIDPRGHYAQFVNDSDPPPTQAELDMYRPIYERYARFGDQEFGRLLTVLQRDPLWSRTLLVVTSDHGESFNLKHPFHATGHTSEGVTRVPLIVHFPGQTRSRRFDGWCGHEDIVPTILSCVYDRVPHPFEGIPLQGADPRNRMLFTWGLHDYYFGGQAAEAAAYQGNWKYLIHMPSRQEALFDLSRDPRARHNRANLEPERLIALRKQTQKTLKLQ